MAQTRRSSFVVFRAKARFPVVFVRLPDLFGFAAGMQNSSQANNVTGLYIAFTQEFFDGTGPSNDSAIHAQSGSADG